MKLFKLAPMLVIAVALGGCGSLDWDHLTSYAGLGDGKPAASPPEETPADTTPVSSAQGAQDRPWTPVGTNDSTKPSTVTASPLASPQTYAAAPAEPVAQPQTYAAPPTYAAPQATAAPQTYAAPAPQTYAAAAPPAYAAPAPAEAPAAADSFCQSAAQSASQEAASQGFDAATQRNRAVTTYNQCVRYGH